MGPTSFFGFSTSFRILGNAALAQTLLTVENVFGAPNILVDIQSVTVTPDFTAAQVVACATLAFSKLNALPTGGTPLAKGSANTALASSANIILRAANAVDDGVATPIAVVLGTRIFSRPVGRLQTLAGTINPLPLNLVTVSSMRDAGVYSLSVRPNEAYAVHLLSTAITSNPITTGYFVNINWTEARET